RTWEQHALRLSQGAQLRIVGAGPALLGGGATGDRAPRGVVGLRPSGALGQRGARRARRAPLLVALRGRRLGALLGRSRSRGLGFRRGGALATNPSSSDAPTARARTRAHRSQRTAR